MLVNCGASEDIKSLLDMPFTARVIVLDSHRPIHYSYANEDTTVLLFHDKRDGTVVEEDLSALNVESEEGQKSVVLQ